jgi:iron complex outermembrane recepter protein
MLNSPVGGFIDYVIGGYIFDQNVWANDNQGGTRNRTDLPPNTYVGTVGQSSYYTARSNSLAAFGQANLHLTDQLTAVLGARYTHDKVGASYAGRPNPLFNFIGVSPPDGEDSAKADDLSFKGTLQYDVTPDLMFFASYAQGYKAPAIGTSRGVIRRVLPETIDSYEIGMKSQWFNRALTFNASVFTQDFKNLQTTAVSFKPDGTYSVELTNAEGVRSRGFELEAGLRAGPDLTLTGSFAYVDTKFLTYLTSCYRGQPINATPGPGCYRQGTGTIFDATGFPSINSPKTTYNLGFNYTPSISDSLKLYTNATWSYRTKAYTTAGDPNTILPGYGLLNANIGIGNPDGSLRLTLYARNLLDKFFVTRIRALQFGTVGSYSHTVPIEAQRTIGIKLDYSF